MNICNFMIYRYCYARDWSHNWHIPWTISTRPWLQCAYRLEKHQAKYAIQLQQTTFAKHRFPWYTIRFQIDDALRTESFQYERWYHHPNEESGEPKVNAFVVNHIHFVRVVWKHIEGGANIAISPFFRNYHHITQNIAIKSGQYHHVTIPSCMPCFSNDWRI